MYTFFSDSGHGWLKVSARELIELDLLQKISRYSFMSASGRWIYLEEDCDLSTYLIATNRSNDWWSLNVKSKYSDRSAVRNYPCIDRDFILYQASLGGK